MKLLFILMALPVLASTCKKNKDTEKDGYVRGKVVRTTCASFVVQVLNDDSIGDDGWKDVMHSNKEYDNVFCVINVCTLPDEVKNSGNSTLVFKIKEATANGCMFCALYDAPPKAKYDIVDVSVEK
jgi:hypothetical protein